MLACQCTVAIIQFLLQSRSATTEPFASQNYLIITLRFRKFVDQHGYLHKKNRWTTPLGGARKIKMPETYKFLNFLYVFTLFPSTFHFGGALRGGVHCINISKD